MKASVEASVEVASVEAFMEASVKVASVQASVEAFMQASVEVAASVKAFMKASEEASVKVALVEVDPNDSHGSNGSFHGSFHEIPLKMEIVKVASFPLLADLIIQSRARVFSLSVAQRRRKR